MAQHNQSLVAVRYPGKLLAREALFSLARLRREGSIQLGDAAVIYKDSLGKTTVYRSGELTSGQHAALSGLAGLALGLVVGKPLRTLVGGSILGGIASTVFSHFRNKPLLELARDVPPDQSVLYMLIIDANWSVVVQRMANLWESSSVLLKQPIAAHESGLARLLGGKPDQAEGVQDEGKEERTVKDKGELPESTQPVASAGQVEEADFTQIRGIGPTIDQRLKENDVHTFAQLAAMNTEEVAALAGVPSSLLIRYDVIDQASLLAAAGQ